MVTQNQKNKNDKFKVFYAISLAWQLGLIIIIPIGIFTFLGWWGDKIIHTSPYLFLIGIITGIVAAVYNIYRSLRPLIRK